MDSYGSKESSNPLCLLCNGEGEVTLFFKNSLTRIVRITSVYCTQCYPESFSVNDSPKKDEVEILLKEAVYLLDECGWSEWSDG